MEEEATIFQKIASAVGTFAPGLAGILAATGVGAPIAGAVAAVGLIAKQFGLPADASHEDVLAAITADPETKLKIIAAENSFQLAQRDQDIQELKTRLESTQGARQADVDKTKATGKRDTNLYVMAWLNILGFYGILAAFVYMLIAGKTLSVSEALGAILYMLIGSMVSNYTNTNSFFFGSSAGSEAKTAMLFNSQPIKK